MMLEGQRQIRETMKNEEIKKVHTCIHRGGQLHNKCWRDRGNER
jgi:hypothetical protein